MSFEMPFFPFWEWTINVLRDTNEFNIDSLLCFKTHIFYSRELLFTRRWAIDSDGVACLVEISLVVRVVLLAICFLCFAFCLLGAIQGEISLCLIMIMCYLAPAARYGSQFTFQVFFPKAVFGFTQALQRFSAEPKGLLPHLMVEWSVQQLRNTNSFISAMWWILSFGTQIISLWEQKMSFWTHFFPFWEWKMSVKTQRTSTSTHTG